MRDDQMSEPGGPPTEPVASSSPPSPSLPSSSQNRPDAPGADDRPTLTTTHGPISSSWPGGASGDEPTGTRPPRNGLPRRAVLLGAGAGVLGLGALGAGLGIALSRRESATGVPNIFASDAQQINHLLRRAGFGPAPSDIGEYLSLGISGAIDRLVNYGAISDDLNARVATTQFDFTKAQDLIRWALLRMIYTKRPLEEKMTLFWSGVLTSSFRKIGKSQNYPLLIQQNKLLRAHAMGKFDDLIRAISTDPAMLWWLDGRTSTGRQPNENYARELMELFTIGLVDAQGNPTYTQDDVHQGALALTGWTIQNGHGVLNPKKQYHGTVSYLGHTGQLGLDDVVTIVCAHPATARHIAWRIWNFFAYATTLGDPALQPMVDAYNQHEHSIGAMVSAMLASSSFFSEKAYRGRVKSPVEFLVGAIRGLGLAVNGDGLPQLMATMGQTLFDPPNVAGWPGDQESANWLSTQAWMSRVNFINLLAVAATTSGQQGKATQTPSTTTTAESAMQAVVAQRGIASARDLVAYIVAALLDNHVTSDRTTALLDALTNAPTDGAQLTLRSGSTVSAAGVRHMLYLAMSLPEYHMN